MPRLVHLVPACILVSCVSGSAPPATVGDDHICSASEHYATQPGDCFATPTAAEAGVTPRSYRAGATWKAWQGLCLVDGDDRLLAGNGVCELQESRTFRSDCEPTCGDSVLTAEEATTCMHDWLTDRRGCVAGTVDCESQPDCGNGLCEYDDQHQEDACTCPQDCTTPAQYRAIRNLDGTCSAPPNDPNPEVVCTCGLNPECEPHENANTCPGDCKEVGTTSSTDDTSTTSGDACDDDPACGTGETPETCPEQCSDCGDSIISGNEECDNGQDNKDHWPSTPPADACSETCTKTVQSCGDGVINGGETCDNGTNDDLYSPMLPEGACASGCVLPGYCGDGEKNGDEACDAGMQTSMCELSCVVPACNDGIHNSLAGEACDDGNPDEGDGCTPECVVELRVFVTKTPYKGDLNKTDKNRDALIGLELADLRCQQHAEAVGLTGVFKAWLSSANVSPSTRFDTKFEGLYRLVDNTIIATKWTGLVSGKLSAPIATDEEGNPVGSVEVWTNTAPDGMVASIYDCDEWSDATGVSNATFGLSAETDVIWTKAMFPGPCSTSRHLYCFENP